MAGERKSGGWQAIGKPKEGARPSPFDGVLRVEAEDDELNLLAAKVFAGKRGELFLEYLRNLTKNYVLGDGLQVNQLVHLEGQRFIVHLIESRASHGRRKPHPES